eukprot:scaffold119139_cov36-Tisochrysis_lutea.AAC.3
MKAGRARPAWTWPARPAVARANCPTRGSGEIGRPSPSLALPPSRSPAHTVSRRSSLQPRHLPPMRISTVSGRSFALGRGCNL